ncbi:MAG: bifunctional phosphoribosylaminoimidazolecarboxamide formyltransferase/IMP cyclohydrolase [Ferruginibacter sp.]
MQKKITSALISVFYKDGLENIVKLLHEQQVTIYSTGGTKDFIDKLNVPCIAVEDITGFPSILSGRVKTLHPLVFGGILGRRNDAIHAGEMKEYNIPEIDLVIVDLYPFEETVAQFSTPSFGGGEGKAEDAEKAIIEKIDIGGPSMIRAAAKNFEDVTVVAAKKDYTLLYNLLHEQNGNTLLEQRKAFAIKAFDVCTAYDTAISAYFHQLAIETPFNKDKKALRYGENPHQAAAFYGNLQELFTQLHGKELSYNNLVDVDAALALINEFKTDTAFAIIKHTNPCGVAIADDLLSAWTNALAGDPESAFGGVLACNKKVDKATAAAINEIFFEVLMAPGFDEDALALLKTKKNRILLQTTDHAASGSQYRSLLNGILWQQADENNYKDWNEAGGRTTTSAERKNLEFANILCKHLKSNAIALVKDNLLVGKGCGQTSRIDALKQAITKAQQFEVNLQGAVLASDAFFPFDDCVKIAHAAGITAFIQPGGSIRDADSIKYCQENNLALVITGIRHFKH